MRYVMASVIKHNQAMAYRIYTTDSLKVIAENTSRINGGSTMNVRYYDLLSHKNSKQEDNRSASEIISRIKTGLNELGKGDMQ